MKKALAVVVAVVLTLSLASVSHAAGKGGNGKAPPGQRAASTGQKGPAGTAAGSSNNGACVGKKGEQCPPGGKNATSPVNGAACNTNTQQCINPASGACVSNHGQYVSSLHKHGNGPQGSKTCGQAATGGTAAGPVRASTTGRTIRRTAGRTAVRGTASRTRMGTTTNRRSTFVPARGASVPPSGVARVGTRVGASGATVTYRSGTRSYQVTQAPSGRYTRTRSSSPGVLGFYGTRGTRSGRSVRGTAGRGVILLPRTGGGSAPGLPILPILFGLVLTASGVLVRGLASARS